MIVSRSTTKTWKRWLAVFFSHFEFPNCCWFFASKKLHSAFLIFWFIFGLGFLVRWPGRRTYRPWKAKRGGGRWTRWARWGVRWLRTCDPVTAVGGLKLSGGGVTPPPLPELCHQLWCPELRTSTFQPEWFHHSRTSSLCCVHKLRHLFPEVRS